MGEATEGGDTLPQYIIKREPHYSQVGQSYVTVRFFKITFNAQNKLTPNETINFELELN